jgi:hypothetical protein
MEFISFLFSQIMKNMAWLKFLTVFVTINISTALPSTTSSAIKAGPTVDLAYAVHRATVNVLKPTIPIQHTLTDCRQPENTIAFQTSDTRPLLLETFDLLLQSHPTLSIERLTMGVSTEGASRHTPGNIWQLRMAESLQAM